MRIAILSRDHTLFSCQRLFSCAQERGHEVDIINPLACYININSIVPSIHYQGSNINNCYDAVIPRLGPLTPFHGLAVLRQLEMFGTYSLNQSSAILYARDKLSTLQLLAARGIPLPSTVFSSSSDKARDLIQMVGGVPLIVKLIQGTQGCGVVLAECLQTAESMIDSFRRMKAPFLVQQFITEANGRDIRCFVVGDKVIASIERQSKLGDFRSNLHCGGTAKKIGISEIERRIAIRSSEALGLHVAGVDLLRTSRESLVIEVNASPGIAGIEKISGIDVTTQMISWIEANIRI